MLCKITASIVSEKYAKVNFKHPKDPNGFVREAVAFPVAFDNNERLSFPLDVFKRVLSVGNELNIVWSKKLNSFVVRFCLEDFNGLC